jgi:hypothetical protein
LHDVCEDCPRVELRKIEERRLFRRDHHSVGRGDKTRGRGL